MHGQSRFYFIWIVILLLYRLLAILYLDRDVFIQKSAYKSASNLSEIKLRAISRERCRNVEMWLVTDAISIQS
jgi:hypothetical protein